MVRAKKSEGSRRDFLRDSLLDLAVAGLLPGRYLMASQRSGGAKGSGNPILKTIPSSGQKIPAIGMGSFRTFNVGKSSRLRKSRQEVLKEFFARGGTLIDSSPMYGTSEEVLGHCLKNLKMQDRVFSATKVWTASKEEGKQQFRDSLNLWGLKKLDLYKIHNLLGLQGHLAELKELKKRGQIQYLGVTTSHNRHVSELQALMKKEPLDFVQFTYSMTERWNDPETLAIAKGQGIAVIVNRPFEKGYIFDKVKNKPLPGIAKELGCRYWSEYFLKWIVAHPAVTCAIPATSQLEHMKENMRALYGPLPDAKMRDQMLKSFLAI